MKQLIYIRAMSLYQEDIIAKMKGRKDKIAEHLAKCVMYGDDLGINKYNHWIEHELATWISDINGLTAKPKDKKLKAAKYEEHLFGPLGDSRNDAQSNLIDLQLHNRKAASPYPYVEIDDDMIDRMEFVSQEMIGKVVPILSTKNNFSKRDIEKFLHSILDPVCLHNY